MEPEIRYAKSGDLYVAYATLGSIPRDLVLVMGFVSHLEHFWEEPRFVALCRRLSAVARVVLFDKRGTGLSDRLPNDRLPTLEERMDDLRAVMDAVGSRRATLVGFWEGGPMAALFAATYPERVDGLVLVNAPLRFRRSEDYPWGLDDEGHAQALEAIAEHWGEGRFMAVPNPSCAGDPRLRRWIARLERLGASPGAALALWRMNMDIDVRHVLPAIRVPTLVAHTRDQRILEAEASRWAAKQIPNARYLELPGRDAVPWSESLEPFLAAVEEFVAGGRVEVERDRVLATIVFLDLVGSTERAAELGDVRWAAVRDAFYDAARREVERHRGRVVKTTGDGLLAVFDGPARAVRSALAAVPAARVLGLEVRAGVHAGECELAEDDVGGLAVHIAARVVDRAGPGQVLVTHTVRDLVAGSGLSFTERETAELRGVPERWRLYEAA
ncbi:MAG: hydrolase [Candidatus Binatia bacterium]|nr:MAG: hydrolase [Candidatus Binatia bacterium]